MPNEPIKAVELMRSIRRALDERYAGLPLAERVRRMSRELAEQPLDRIGRGAGSPRAGGGSKKA